jgi:hypothetical protein
VKTGELAIGQMLVACRRNYGGSRKVDVRFGLAVATLEVQATSDDELLGKDSCGVVSYS